MRDTQRPYRMAIFNTINGLITLNSIVVPVYDEKKKATSTANIYILLSTQQETDFSTSDAFITRSSIDIEIIHRTEFEVTKDDIDEIADQFLQLVMPTPDTNALPVQNLFQIINMVRTSTITRQYNITDTETIVAKIINLTSDIVQQFP